MEFLSLTLTVGCFLMGLPYLSEGLNVAMRMSSLYGALNTEFKVTCDFKADQQAPIISLSQGGEMITTNYMMDKRTFVLAPNKQISLNVSVGTTLKKGSLTFIFPRLKCADFTWYVCKVNGDFTSMDSNNQTLQVLPTVDLIRKVSTGEPVVHQNSNFECIGSISKEGPYSVKWYQRTITLSSQLTAGNTRVTHTDGCHRQVLSSVKYNISDTDIPTVILWCVIEGERTVQRMGNFTVQEMSTVGVTFIPQPVKAGLEAGGIVGIVLGIIALIVLVVLLVWFLIIRPKRLKADGASKDQGPEPNAKDYQVQDNVLYATVDPLKKEGMKGEVNPTMDDKHDADNAPYTVYPPSEYETAPGGYENQAMDQDMPNHMSGSTV